LPRVTPKKPVDYIATVIALLGQAMPTFWLGIMLILIFSVRLGWFPSSGRGHLEAPVLPGFPHRAHPPAHPVGHARVAGAGLYPPRTRQGRERAAGGVEARVAERLHSH